jgi:hypothetical protein
MRRRGGRFRRRGGQGRPRAAPRRRQQLRDPGREVRRRPGRRLQAPQLCRQLPAVGPTLVGHGAQAALHGGAEARQRLVERARRASVADARLHPHHLAEDGVDALAVEEAPPDHHLVEERPQGEEVAAPVQGLSRELLGGHVRRRALRHPGLRGVSPHPLGFGDAEVADLDDAIAADEHIGGLEVAVDQPAPQPRRLHPVRVVQRAGDGLGDGERDRWRQAALDRERAVERDAVDELHGDPRQAAVLAEVVGLDDVGVVEQAAEARLAHERAAETRVVLRDVRADELDGAALREALGPLQPGLEHARHAALAEEAPQRVAADALRRGAVPGRLSRAHPGSASGPRNPGGGWRIGSRRRRSPRGPDGRGRARPDPRPAESSARHSG